MPLIHYTIRDQYEECECHRCGTPLDAGDTAWTDRTEGPVWCSKGCAKRDEMDRKLEASE